ncbi:glycosylhydrolase-like jelly roll fold domain-containing protein [Gracilibacillus alcaliphilus]|uniref:glycosylhydrolase-like jelly roll fold domain-containing protein n=1 Tax=Gracilibacillus alcaliphilus TaxID=1401441 RepID=UPI001957C1D9|nr:glycosylhydrolase-like jelly roll fold domain-containing protein [Gracilibacillus alcaliphilus]MBM7677439.1 hypothetical protein [Gracilibacillus alcaliphilus]
MQTDLHRQFINPPDEFSPIPFWFWNDALSEAEIDRQIEDFYQKGVKGFVLHPRIGLPEELSYLSADFLSFVETAVKKAQALDMSVILYDEGMYPSGAANGLVVKDNPEYASRGLAMKEFPIPEQGTVTIELKEGEELVSVQAVKKLAKDRIEIEKTVILEVQYNEVYFQPEEKGDWSVVVFLSTFSQGHIRGIHFGEDDGEPQAPRSADLLNPAAVKKFIERTHDTYYQALKPYFGDPITAMFTDEPDILGRGALPGLKPWTTGFLAIYQQEGNLESHLPVLWFEAGEQTNAIRKSFQQAVNHQLNRSYYIPISRWCEQHGIALTGHPAASDDIGLLDAFQIPGQDVVWRWVAPEADKGIEGEHSTAGKCSSDAARHRGRRRNLNEVLGACGKESGWALSADDMKWYIDWLAVRGINLFCPHAFYYSIRGEKRSHERPPDVGPHNLWWPYYNQFSQYMKRLSWLMTDAVNDTGIAVLCEENYLPWRIVKPLYQHQIEFNYLEESLFVNQSDIREGAVYIQQQKYQLIIVENNLSLNKATVRKLASFVQNGGKVIALQQETETVLDSIAVMISQTDEILQKIPAVCQNQVSILPAEPDIRLSKVKKDGSCFYLLVNEGEETYQGKIRLQEKGRVEKWDAWKGTYAEQALEENRYMPITLPRRSSIIYYVDPTKAEIWERQETKQSSESLAIQPEWIVSHPSFSQSISDLTSWTEWEGMAYFSGVLRYENSFKIPDLSPDCEVILDLGVVHQIASVCINQQEIGVQMWAPYQWVIPSDYLRVGENSVSIDVRNSIANQMDKIALPAGLLGPVSVTLVQT